MLLLPLFSPSPSPSLYINSHTEAHHSLDPSSSSRPRMSSRRSRPSSSSKITDEQIDDLMAKLQSLLPEARRLRSNGGRVPASKALQETCSYIRSLHREVDDLSERLSALLATTDMSAAQAAIIRSLI